MAEIMFAMGAFGLEHVVVVVCNLPPSTPGLGHLRHIFRPETVVGHKRMGGELFARFGMCESALDPMDCERVLPVLEQNVIEEARACHFRHAPLPVTLFTGRSRLLGLPKGHAFIHRGMRVRLTHQDKVAPLMERQRQQF